MSKMDFQETLERLRREFIDDASERLDRIDGYIDRLYRNDGDLKSDLVGFQREIHSMKGSAGTYGFHSVTLIAHRLEDYIETIPQISRDQMLSFQAYVDRMREILESGTEIEEQKLKKILDELPSSALATQSLPKGQADNIFLVMPKGVQRRLITTELVSRGFRMAFSSHPLEAFGLVISLKPKLIVSSIEFDQLSGVELAHALRGVDATKNIPIVLFTSYDAKKLNSTQIPENTRIIHKGPNFASELGDQLMDVELIA
ncbi:MAG: response regulator [Alphaproteobacteria bacterium]|nr:response regulator [Alphaproteobacteria bacterium]